MSRLFIALVVLVFSCQIQAKEANSFYQIDLIVFAQEQDSSLTPEFPLSSTLATNSRTIPLSTEASKNQSPYHLLPFSLSQLREEYWALHRKRQYRVLMNYSWLQPLNNQSTIALPKINRDGWEVEGSLRIRQGNYYLLDTELLFTAPDKNQAPFVFAQKLRLKGGDTYYLDHPQAGMLIKVHKLG